MWGVFVQFKKNADAEWKNCAGYRRACTAAESGLWTARRDWLPCNKRPTDLANVVEHVAPLRHALGPWLAGMGILNHMLSDVVAQTVDLILVTVLEHAGEVATPVSRLSKVSRRGDSKYVTCGRAPI